MQKSIFIVVALFVHMLLAQDSQPSNSGDLILAVKSFLSGECPAAGENVSEDKYSHYFSMTQAECKSFGELLWMKNECTEQGFKYTVCVDENCENCSERTLAEDECVHSRNFMCIPKDRVQQIVNLQEQKIKLSVHQLQEGGDTECTDQNIFAFAYFTPGKCETFMGFYFKMSLPQEENAQNANLQLFSDRSCQNTIPFIQGVTEIPVALNACMNSAMVEGSLALQLTLEGSS